MAQSIQDFFSGPLGQLILNILIAFAILLIGGLIAALVAKVVRGLLKRINLDNRISEALTEEGGEQRWPVEDVIGKVTFWTLMLFVIVAALEQLNLTGVAQPINNLLTAVTTVYIPRLFAAGILLLVAWLVAVILRYLTRKILHLFKIDERLSSAGAVEEGKDVNITEALATAVFWFVFLLFLPSVLIALGLDSMAQVFMDVFDSIIGWIPFILMAIVIGIIGWFLARIVRQIAASVLKAFGVDGFGEKLGIKDDGSLSEILANILYYVILVIVLIAALDALQLDVISQPLTSMLEEIVAFIPGLLGAIVILIVAYYIGRLVANIVRDLLANVGFNSLPQKLGLSWNTTTVPSEWVGTLTLIIIMLFAATYAAEVMGSEFLVVTLSVFINFLWEVFLAVVIFAFGLYFAKLAYSIVNSTGLDHANLLGRLAQFGIIVFAGAIALQTLNIASDIINLSFGILLAGAAFAAALAFGLGSRDIAGREVDNFLTAWRSDEDISLPSISTNAEADADKEA